MDTHIRNLKVTPRKGTLIGAFFLFGIRVRDKSGRGSGVYVIKHNRLCVGAPTNMMPRISAAAQKFLKKFKQLVTFLFYYVVLCGINILILISIKILIYYME